MRQLILIVLVLVTNPIFSQESKPTLRLTSDIWPPFTNVEGQRTIALDIVEMALTRSGIEFSFQIQEFTEVISGINEKKYEGSAALWINSERQKSLLFSEPYLQNQLILVGRKGINVNFSDLVLLEGKKVGVIEDYAYGESLLHPNVDWVYGKSDQENLDRLLAGQLDYILVEALLIQYLFRTQLADVKNYLSVGVRPLLVKTLHFAIRKDISEGDKIIESFNQEIKNMIADGSYNDILDLSWIHADVDGDGIPELVLEGEAAGLEAPANPYNVFYSKPVGSKDRYYIDGNIYEGWENVPSESKLAIPKVPPGYEGKGELKIRLK